MVSPLSSYSGNGYTLTHCHNPWIDCPKLELEHWLDTFRLTPLMAGCESSGSSVWAAMVQDPVHQLPDYHHGLIFSQIKAHPACHQHRNSETCQVSPMGRPGQINISSSVACIGHLSASSTSQPLQLLRRAYRFIVWE